MGKTTTYTVPENIVHGLRALSLKLNGDGLSIGSTFGHASAVTEVAIPAPSQSKTFE